MITNSYTYQSHKIFFPACTLPSDGRKASLYLQVMKFVLVEESSRYLSNLEQYEIFQNI